MPIDAKQRLFAWCVASCLKPQLAIEDRADPVIEAVGQRLAIPFADYWRPTAANYWGRAKKAHSLAIGRQILGERWARDHADEKKPVLADGARERLRSRAQRPPASVSTRRRATTPRRGCRPAWPMTTRAADPGHNGADRTGLDDGDPGAGDADIASADLPAFLTDDRPDGIALNGAAAD